MDESRLENTGQDVLASRAGPEQTTLAEKFVGLLRLPYVLSCVIWALVLFEIPTFLARTLDPGSQQIGADEPASIAFHMIAVFLVAVYFPVAVRFVRHKALEAEVKLSPLLPGGEADYHRAFGPAGSYRGQILTIAAIALLAVYVIWKTDSLAFRIVDSICAVYVAITMGSLIWFILGCAMGLYQVGGKPLQFRPYREDPTLGVRPMGALALSLAGGYFGGVLVLVLLSAFSSKVLNSAYLWAIYGALILAGLVLFFLPLGSVHRRMAEEKSRQNTLIQDQFDWLTHELKSREEGDLADIRRLLVLDIADRKLQALSTWPFDTTILGKLSVILVSVSAAVIARYVSTL